MEQGMNDKLHPALAEHAMETELQLERERHRKTWRQLEQMKGLLREAVDLKNHHSITDLTDPVRMQIDAALSEATSDE